MLKKSIREAGFDPALKRWLNDLAGEMQRALDEYEICGGRSFVKAWSFLFGNFVLRQKEFAEVIQQAPKVAKRSASIIDKLGDFAKRAKVKEATIFMLGAIASGSGKEIGKRITGELLGATAKYMTITHESGAQEGLPLDTAAEPPPHEEKTGN